VSAFCSPCFQDGSSGLCFHSFSETVAAFSFQVARLKRSLHEDSLLVTSKKGRDCTSYAILLSIYIFSFPSFNTYLIFKSFFVISLWITFSKGYIILLKIYKFLL